jgi:uncharacterized cupin superfamily protein
MRRISLSDPTFAYEPDDPEGFRSGSVQFGPDLGAQQTGATAYELPPGQSVCPYHYEYGEEEWVLVLEGRPSLRTPEGTEPLEPLDMVFFPKGPAGAHELRNDTEDRVRILMWSNVVHPTATAYPDSDKIGIWTGNKDDDVLVPRSAAVSYYTGETPST